MNKREFFKTVCSLAGAVMLTGCVSCDVANRQNKEQGEKNMFVVRIAEIEVHPEWLEAYLAAAGTVGAESVAKEPGVVCIYKEGTPHMINSLKLVPMQPLDTEHADSIFKKWPLK